MQLKNKFNYAKSALHSRTQKGGAHGNYFNCMHSRRKGTKSGLGQKQRKKDRGESKRTFREDVVVGHRRVVHLGHSP